MPTNALRGLGNTLVLDYYLIVFYGRQPVGASHRRQGGGRRKTISMVMRYPHHHPEILRAGIEILDCVPAGVSTGLAQSANFAGAGAGTEFSASC